MLVATIVVVLLLVTAMFTMAEIAVVSSNKFRLGQQAQRGDGSAAAVLALARTPTRFLSTVQIGITLISIFAGAFGEKKLSKLLADELAAIEAIKPFADVAAMVVVVTSITLITIILGELVPKRIAISHPEAVAKIIARPLLAISMVFSPVIRLLTAATDLVVSALRVREAPQESASAEEIMALIGRGAKTGVFERTEQQLVDRVFRVGDLRVAALMVPRADVAWLDADDSIEDVRRLVADTTHSHFPVCRGSMDRVLGVVHVKALLRHAAAPDPKVKLVDLCIKPVFMPDATPALKALETFQRTRVHVALVVDEYGVIKGLITLNDLVQAIVGDLARTADDQPIVRRDDGSLSCDARLPIDRLAAELGLPAGYARPVGVHTVAGLILAVLGRLPKVGEVADWNDYLIEVVDLDGRRIDRVIVRPKPKAE